MKPYIKKIKSPKGDYRLFFKDAILADGRGHFLSSYDGEETEIKVGKTWFYIYRQN
jgi:hypothetical protein